MLLGWGEIGKWGLKSAWGQADVVVYLEKVDHQTNRIISSPLPQAVPGCNILNENTN